MLRKLSIFATISFLTGLFLPPQMLSGQNKNSAPVILKEGLVIHLPFNKSNILTPDNIETLLETGRWESPAEGEKLVSNDTAAGTWRNIQANDRGWFRDKSLRNAYVDVRFPSPEEKIILLEAMGNEMVYVNGVARSGNPYADKDVYETWETKFNYSLLPVRLKKGENDLLFRCNRGMLKVVIHPVEQGLLLNEKDVTLPDLLARRVVHADGAIPIINATEHSYGRLFIKTSAENFTPEYAAVRTIQALSIYKAPFHIKLPVVGDSGTVNLFVELVEKTSFGERVLTSATLPLHIVGETDVRKETFISALDSSVQYFAVKPPMPLSSQTSTRKLALFLSLHGAGVEATNQAKSYGPENWGYIVAPTNRRPYGFNWENWGRLDALEVLDIATKEFPVDRDRIYLTGHSMGGHGAWHLGINYSDRFAAVGPSAGWISIWSYRILPLSLASDVSRMLIRSAKQSDTYAFASNLTNTPVYVLQGSEDDNVPPAQARSMIDTLSRFSHDYVYHEQPGVGHWWDLSDEDGADCVDWPPMFDFFARHAAAGNERIKHIDFTTANPAVASKNYWIEILNQAHQQQLSRISIHVDIGKRRFVGATNNITLFSINAEMLPGNAPVSLEIDSQKIADVGLPPEKILYLQKTNAKWSLTGTFSTSNKYPARTGNFREVLNHDVVFVYGTHGSKEENEWAFTKARYDAEKLWYQGNGAVEVIRDAQFGTETYRNRSVVLYGNAATNSAWKLLLADSPVRVTENSVTVGKKTYRGSDLSCMMIRPRRDSERASVAVVSGTGIRGMQLTTHVQYFHPYMSLPDLVLYDGKIVQSDEDGVLLAGYFGNNWSLETGEFIGRISHLSGIEQ
ncbi:MAG: prolyl oligopeptidase family serine peptidase [Bacteroidota bacterium]|nr:prolyl oligopeptidase family serine peptidase [Bacteroidota bacterium]